MAFLRVLLVDLCNELLSSSGVQIRNAEVTVEEVPLPRAVPVAPSPATHSIWTVLKAGKAVYQTVEIFGTWDMPCIIARIVVQVSSGHCGLSIVVVWSPAF